MTTWKKEIYETLERLREPLIQCTLSDEELNHSFDNSFGMVEGASFTAWTEHWVLFPVCYDGSEWVGIAPRNPCNISSEHQGGG